MQNETETPNNLGQKLNFKRLTEAKAPGFKLLANGLYIIKVVGFEIKEKNPGKPVANWTLDVLPGDNVMFSDGEVVTTTQKLWHSYSLTPSDKYDPDSRLRELVEAVDAALLEKDELLLSEVYGKFAKVQVITEPERHDKVTNRTYPARNAIKTFTPCTPEELQALLG